MNVHTSVNGQLLNDQIAVSMIPKDQKVQECDARMML